MCPLTAKPACSLQEQVNVYFLGEKECVYVNKPGGNVRVHCL